ncbi:hypothetical protein C8R45DRAFT_922482 [Mycena sanguinolenta]|nr:hypothetical protein C8R45DRAFT_922482 [Mycena sanguinolenta]
MSLASPSAHSTLEFQCRRCLSIHSDRTVPQPTHRAHYLRCRLPPAPRKGLRQGFLESSLRHRCLRVELSDAPDQLVKHLFDCLYGDALHFASYQLSLLPPRPRVLATCICALSFHGPRDGLRQLRPARPETRIHAEVSEDNVASSFLLDVLERLNAAPSRPWAVSFVAYSRREGRTKTLSQPVERVQQRDVRRGCRRNGPTNSAQRAARGAG